MYEFKKETILIKKFLKEEIEFDVLSNELKKSRATIYRWIRIIYNGGKIEDKRRQGNNRICMRKNWEDKQSGKIEDKRRQGSNRIYTRKNWEDKQK